MKKQSIIFLAFFTFTLYGIHSVQAQDTLGQQAYAILENRCLNCHGPGVLLQKTF